MDRNKKDIVYVLKKVKKDMSSNDGGFKYPKRGWVEARDWKCSSKCGNGLHGLEWGCGEFDINGYGDLFLVLRVDKKDGYVDLGDKVKFKRGYVVLVTKSSKKAIEYIEKKAPEGLLFNYSYSDQVVSNQGYRSTSNQGNWSTSNQGNWSTSNQGYRSTSNQGDESTSNQGNRSTSNQGYRSTSNQRNESTSNQWDESTSNQGYGSTSNQGYRSTSSQGNWSTSNQGDESTSSQGNWSVAVIRDGGRIIYRNSGGNSAIVMFSNDTMKVFKQNEDYNENETIKIVDMEIVKKYKGTSSKINKLEDWEVFVFGSNMQGNHIGGAARLAKEKFGAKDGIGEGLVGNSYAFPTLNKNMKKRSEKNLELSVNKLIECAALNTTKIFLLTKVGCGIAGYEDEFMEGLFDRRDIPANIVKPVNWYN
ncbi:MAG: hypothetical protein ACFFDH_00280 [Promethearchaeota archaeon]